MKICVINNIFYPYSRGGSDRIARLLVDGLIAKGHDVFVVSTKPKKEKVKKVDYKIYYLNSLFFGLEKIPKIFRLFWHIGDTLDVLAYLEAKKILGLEKPDLVITHNLKGLGYTIPFAIKKEKIKHIHVLHDVQLFYPSGLMHLGKERVLEAFLPRIYTYLNNSLFKKTDLVISPSRWLLEEHKKRGFFKFSEKVVLPNPVTFDVEEAFIERTDKKIFVVVGEIEEHKGAFFITEAFKKIYKQGEKCEVVFIGEGSKSEELEKITSDNKNIKYLGKLSNSDVKKNIQAATGLIMASTCYENSPTVIYEAASLGIPVLASRIGGITELVHHLGGYLFSPGNEDDFIGKIKYIIKKPDKFRKIGLDSQEKIKAYKIDDYIEKINKII